MNRGIICYEHDLGNRLSLNAFSIDPSMNADALKDMVVSKDGQPTPDLENLVKETVFVDKVDSVEGLQIQISDERYMVPDLLKKFRKAVQFQSDSIGRYNGPVLIVDQKVQVPLRCFKGSFYDFVATKLDTVPSDLEGDLQILAMLPEDSLFWRAFSESFLKAGGQRRLREIYNDIKGLHGKGKKIEQLFNEEDIPPAARARYFGLGYIVLTNNGNEISFVQRAKGMAIAADCISNAGSTPNPPFDEPGFDIHKYLNAHIREEMGEEYNLQPSEFNVGGLMVFDDNKQVPFADVIISTPLKTRDLAERIYGKKQAIKEHPVLYSTSPNAISKIIERFPIFPPFVQGLRVFNKYN